mgnify:CR=1 FL=1
MNDKQSNLTGKEIKDNEPYYRCNSRKTNADRIRNMSDEERVGKLVCN